jgi:hypothetical protein
MHRSLLPRDLAWDPLPLLERLTSHSQVKALLARAPRGRLAACPESAGVGFLCHAVRGPRWKRVGGTGPAARGIDLLSSTSSELHG